MAISAGRNADHVFDKGPRGTRVATMPSVAKPSMDVNISFRIKRELRDAAREKAEERQENVSDVLREALERYVKRK